jgi:hypothetical protein
MTEFRPLTFDALTVGEEFVSDEHLVTPEDIETYAFAVDDHHPWFFGASPFGGPVAHPTLLGNCTSTSSGPSGPGCACARGAA